jgi:diacylglycerol kinase (ATP)
MDAERNVLIAANPKSGKGSTLELVAKLNQSLQSCGYRSQVVTNLDQLQSSAIELHQQHRLTAVVSAGGDGTISTLANLLPHDVPLMIFPLGTENLLARYWGLTTDIAAACNTLRSGRVVQMDVGLANGKLFLVMLSCGFDAAVVHCMHAQRVGPIRRWMYAGPILKSLMRYKYPEMAWTEVCGHVPQEHHAAWIFVFNVPRYAAALNFCPLADPLDGRLDVCTFQGSGLWKGLYYLAYLWRGQHESLPDYTHRQVRKMTIQAPRDQNGQPIEVPYQIDGDPGGMLPLTIEIQPGRLRLMVPEVCQTSDPIAVERVAFA